MSVLRTESISDVHAAGQGTKSGGLYRRSPGRWLPGLQLPVHQVRRAFAEPQRLTRLHYSSVLASLHSIWERDEFSALQAHFDVDAPRLQQIERDLLDSRGFCRSIEERHRELRGKAIRLLGATPAEDHDRSYRILYYLTRLARPRIVVETGVFDGFSSAFILKALHDNRHGELCSIDLPATSPQRASTDKMVFDTLPHGCAPGWVIPTELRERWTLRTGTSDEHLGPWLGELGPIDLFFHDSLHTLANMTREFETAWPAISVGGFLVSDDIFWSRAFHRFSNRLGLRRSILKGVGVVRKPLRNDSRVPTALRVAE